MKQTKLQNKKSKEQGFTLIEILVVIGIIAVLAAIVLVAINPARQFAQARDSQRTSNVTAILDSIGQYMADHQGDVPAGVPTVPATGDTTVAISNSAMSGFCADIVPDYMQALTVDPNTDPDGTGGLDEGAAIEEADCSGTWDTGYELTRHENGRITVFAPDTEVNDPDGDGTVDNISITR